MYQLEFVFGSFYTFKNTHLYTTVYIFPKSRQVLATSGVKLALFGMESDLSTPCKPGLAKMAQFFRWHATTGPVFCFMYLESTNDKNGPVLVWFVWYCWLILDLINFAKWGCSL